jgi:hypothetical protein
MAATLLLAVVLTAGCSSSPDKAGSAGASAPAKDTSPLSGMSALEVWAKTKSDADATKSVHITAKFLDGEQKIGMNLKMTDSGKVFGELKVNNDEILVRRLGKTLYFKSDRGFWTRNADAATAAALGGKWVKVQQGFSADLEQFFELTDMDFIVSDVMSLSAAEQETLKLEPGIGINHQKTVALVDETTSTEAELQTLYVSVSNPALPLHFAIGSDNSQYMKFRSWNKDFTVVAPQGAIDLAKAS